MGTVTPRKVLKQGKDAAQAPILIDPLRAMDAESGVLVGVESRDHGCQFSREKVVISIEETDDIAGRCGECSVQASRHSAMLTAHQNHGTAAIDVTLDDFARAIFRAVVGDDDFNGLPRLGQNAFNRARKELLIVVIGDEDRDFQASSLCSRSSGCYRV